jgi:hypothetical protein
MRSKLPRAIRKGRISANRIGRGQQIEDMALKSLLRNHPRLMAVSQPIQKIQEVIKKCPDGQDVNLSNTVAMSDHIDIHNCHFCQEALDRKE